MGICLHPPNYYDGGGRLKTYIIRLLGAVYEVDAVSASSAKRLLAAKLRRRAGLRSLGTSHALQSVMVVKNG